MNEIISVSNLTKKFKDVNAVNGVSFTVTAGTCFGLLGPNGAGKSTTIEIMEGILKPSSGEILYRGKPISTEYRSEIGIQFQSTALQDFLTVKENLNFFGALYPSRLSNEELIARCRLADFLNRDTRKLSGGQRQRVLLAIALINDPKVLFLDEPTTGLDPQARRNFWELIQEIKADGKTIVLTTHYMDEAYSLSDEIAIMDHGKLISRGTPEGLLAERFKDVVVELPKASLISGLEFWGAHAKGDVAEIITSDLDETIKKLQSNNVSLYGLKVRPRSLEDLFLDLTGKELRS